MKKEFDNKTTKELLIQYFEKTLVKNNKFKKTGDNSFCYHDKVDVIFVYVTETNITVISDGKGVVDGMFMLRIHDINNIDFSNVEELEEEYFNDNFLQEILCLF